MKLRNTKILEQFKPVALKLCFVQVLLTLRVFLQRLLPRAESHLVFRPISRLFHEGESKHSSCPWYPGASNLEFLLPWHSPALNTSHLLMPLSYFIEISFYIHNVLLSSSSRCSINTCWFIFISNPNSSIQLVPHIITTPNNVLTAVFKTQGFIIKIL